MALTKAVNAQFVKSGFWIFASYRLYVTKRQFYRFRRRQFAQLAGSRRPVEVLRDGRRTLWWMRNDFFWDTDNTSEEVELLLWDRSRRKDAKVARLRKIRVRAEDIATSRRERIPHEVRVHVWERDEAKCVRCGSDGNLQFDHVIPVAKGGSNSDGNVQLLCGDCNLLKSDSIV